MPPEYRHKEIKDALRLSIDDMYIDHSVVNGVIESFAGRPLDRTTLHEMSRIIEGLNEEARQTGLRNVPFIPNLSFEMIQELLGLGSSTEDLETEDQEEKATNDNEGKLRLIEKLVRCRIDATQLIESFASPEGDVHHNTYKITSSEDFHVSLGLEPILRLIPSSEQHDAIVYAFESFVDQLTEIASAGGVLQYEANQLIDSSSTFMGGKEKPSETDIEFD